MEARYKVATPRKEAREGRSFNPDEFAIHLEQVNAISNRLNLRPPRRDSLEILVRVREIISLDLRAPRLRRSAAGRGAHRQGRTAT